MWILLVLLLFSIASGEVIKKVEFDFDRTRYLIRLHNSPVYQMFWVKQKEGGYKLAGKAPEDCNFLTDMKIDEFVEFLKKEYGYIYNRLPVKSLNAIVRVNAEPFLVEPYSPNINPTITHDLIEINRYFRKNLPTLIQKDPKIRDIYNRFLKNYLEAGLNEKEAKRKALIETAKVIKPKIKKWIPEEKLPKNLFIVCKSSYFDFGKNTDVKKYDIFPVSLSVKKEGINITKMNKTDKFVELTLSFFPFLQKNNRIYLDLITINPPKVQIKGCSYAYIGAYIYPLETYQPEYHYSLESTDEGFYLVIIPYEPVKDIKVRLKLDYYCSKTKKDKISLLNPDKLDKSSLNTYIDLGYSHKKFLKRYGIKKLQLKLQIKGDSYSSGIFTLELP